MIIIQKKENTLKSLFGKQENCEETNKNDSIENQSNSLIQSEGNIEQDSIELNTAEN